MAVVQLKLFLRRLDTQDLRGARRQLREDHLSGSAEQDGRQAPAKLVEIPVSQHASLFIRHSMRVEEAERGAKLAVVDELHYRIQLVQPVFQGRACQYEGKGRTQGLDHLRGPGLPVLDPLSLVEDDQVPWHRFNGKEIPEHLLVIGDRVECPAAIQSRPFTQGTYHDLACPLGCPLNFQDPLGFHGSRADHQDARDPLFPRKQLGGPDALERLAKPHVICDQGPAGPGGERDPVQLVGEKLDFQEILSQGMGPRVGADRSNGCIEPLTAEQGVHHLLRVGIDMNGMPQPLQLPDALHEIGDVMDGSVAQRRSHRVGIRRKTVRKKQSQLSLVTVADVQGDAGTPVGAGHLAVGEPPFHSGHREQEVLAGAQRICLEIGARAVRFAPLPPPERHPVRLPRQAARHRVIAPNPLPVKGSQGHPLRSRPFGPVCERPLDQLAFGQHLQGNRFARRRGKPEGQLLLQDQ